MREGNIQLACEKRSTTPFDVSLMAFTVELLELLRTAAIVVGVLSFVGFVIYFLYGLRNSSENRPLSAYSQVLSYGGNDASGKKSTQCRYI